MGETRLRIVVRVRIIETKHKNASGTLTNKRKGSFVRQGGGEGRTTTTNAIHTSYFTQGPIILGTTSADFVGAARVRMELMGWMRMRFAKCGNVSCIFVGWVGRY